MARITGQTLAPVAGRTTKIEFVFDRNFESGRSQIRRIDRLFFRREFFEKRSLVRVLPTFSIYARRRFAFVYVDLTKSTLVAVMTHATERIHAVDARSVILTLYVTAIVNIDFAMTAAVATFTALALETIYQIDACRIVGARTTRAFVYVNGARWAGEARIALTKIAVDQIDTSAAERRARIRLALVYIYFAMLAKKTVRTFAIVRVY